MRGSLRVAAHARPSATSRPRPPTSNMVRCADGCRGAAARMMSAPSPSQRQNRHWIPRVTSGVTAAVVTGVAEHAMTGGTSGLIPLVSGVLGAIVGPWVTATAPHLWSWVSFPNCPPQKTWTLNSRDVNEREHWKTSSVLVIGVQYSPKFVKDFFDVIQTRSTDGLTTVVLIVDPDSAASRYLVPSIESRKIEDCVREIQQLLKEADGDRGYVRLKKHERVLRYSFIRAEGHIWVKFHTNASYRTLVPAVRIDSASELFAFFEEDARRLEGGSVDYITSSAPAQPGS